jgi:hypothetical protein
MLFGTVRYAVRYADPTSKPCLEWSSTEHRGVSDKRASCGAEPMGIRYSIQYSTYACEIFHVHYCLSYDVGRVYCKGARSTRTSVSLRSIHPSYIIRTGLMIAVLSVQCLIRILTRAPLDRQCTSARPRHIPVHILYYPILCCRLSAPQY